jgi:hypothetical protein
LGKKWKWFPWGPWKQFKELNIGLHLALNENCYYMFSHGVKLTVTIKKIVNYLGIIFKKHVHQKKKIKTHNGTHL